MDGVCGLEDGRYVHTCVRACVKEVIRIDCKILCCFFRFSFVDLPVKQV